MPSRRDVLAAAGLLAAAPVSARSQPRTLPLTVSAAASLTNALREIGSLFEESRPEVQLRLNFGGSGALLQQIAQGAPVDVLVSADEDTVDRGIARTLLAAETRRDVAGNSLVLVTPVGRRQPATLQDLAGAAIRRIAIGKPATVPAGRYAQQALETAGLWSLLADRFVYGENVRQVLDYVSRGEVDAGLVYATDARILRERVRVAATVGGHAPIRYPAIVVADTRRRELALSFIEFLRSGPARERLAAAGFTAADR